MSDQGEQGETGEQGEAGNVGERGDHGQQGDRGIAGERGEKGDHGQPGDVGPSGRTGKTGGVGLQGASGKQGPRGAPYESWLTRHVVSAYLLMALGVVVSIAVASYALTESTDRLDVKARELCAAGNLRSDLQRTVFIEGRDRTAKFDFRSIINEPEPERTRLAEQLKRESIEASDRNISRVPYVDCATGKRIPPPPSTTQPNP